MRLFVGGNYLEKHRTSRTTHGITVGDMRMFSPETTYKMDNTQRYFTQTIVGTPQRIVLGHQVRFDNDPTFPGSDKPAQPDHWLSRISFAFARSPVDATESEMQTIDLPRVQPAVITARDRTLRIALLSLPVVVAVAVFGNLASGWFDEYKQQSGSVQADAHAGAPATTEQTASTTTQVSVLPLSGASSTATPGVSGAITLMDEPSNIPHDGAHPSANTQVTASAIVTQPVVAVVVAPPVKVTPSPVPKQIIEQAKQETTPVPVKVLPLPIQQAPTEPKRDVETNAAAKVAKNPATPAPPKEEERKGAVVMDTPKPTPEIKPVVVAPTSKTPDDTQAPVTRRFSTPMEINPAGQSTTPPKATEAAESPKAEPTGKSAARRVTVVDISPDGSYALVTNPETRLPQKFKAGDKIFTGETIQKIEPKSGKLVLDSRNVYME